MKKTRCRFCDGTNILPRYTLRDFRLHDSDQYQLVQCGTCGLLFIDPQPGEAEIKRHYPDEYHGYHRKPISGLQRLGVSRRIKAILSIKEDGKSLLDIGCATGQFMNEFRVKTGWSVTGIEPIPSAAEFARKNWHLDILPGYFDRRIVGKRRFDVITLWDVLEHTGDPQHVLGDIHAVLNHDGWLVMKIPDPSAMEARIFKSDWSGYEAPQHLFAFPQPMLIKALKEIGFDEIRTGHLGYDYASFYESVGNRVYRKVSKALGKAIILFPKSQIGRIIAPLFVIPIRLIGIRSSRLYYAHKPREN